MTTPLVDLVAQYNSVKEEIDDAVSKVLRSGRFIGGDEVELFESEMADYCNVGHAVSVASGTDALRLSLIACGIMHGDEVITTPFTFIATAEAISQCGATPVFCDIDPLTYNIDPAGIEDKITVRTKAIIPVHLYGQPAGMDAILNISRYRGLKVIEDCAQALGATYRGDKIGSLGDAGCLSFFPGKMLGAYGDGGMVVTNDGDIADKIRLLKNHGNRNGYHCEVHGFNSRLDAMQAAILRVKLKHLDRWVADRHMIAVTYSELLEWVDGINTPCVASSGGSAFNYYTVRISPELGRDGLADYLRHKGIATAVYYPESLHLQAVYRDLGYRYGDLPHSERAQDEVLSLPIYPELRLVQVAEIVKRIKEFAG